MTKRRHSDPTFVTKRFPLWFLSEVVYFTRPMSRELAETIRALRRDHELGYDEVMWALAESDPAIDVCFSFGKALIERARLELQDNDPSWK
jgi:hypothetical protein